MLDIYHCSVVWPIYPCNTQVTPASNGWEAGGERCETCHAKIFWWVCIYPYMANFSNNPRMLYKIYSLSQVRPVDGHWKFRKAGSTLTWMVFTIVRRRPIYITAICSAWITGRALLKDYKSQPGRGNGSKPKPRRRNNASNSSKPAPKSKAKAKPGKAAKGKKPPKAAKGSTSKRSKAAAEAGETPEAETPAEPKRKRGKSKPGAWARDSSLRPQKSSNSQWHLIGFWSHDPFGKNKFDDCISSTVVNCSLDRSLRSLRGGAAWG